MGDRSSHISVGIVMLVLGVALALTTGISGLALLLVGLVLLVNGLFMRG